jgi:hypothetical protein
MSKLSLVASQFDRPGRKPDASAADDCGQRRHGMPTYAGGTAQSPTSPGTALDFIGSAVGRQAFADDVETLSRRVSIRDVPGENRMPRWLMICGQRRHGMPTYAGGAAPSPTSPGTALDCIGSVVGRQAFADDVETLSRRVSIRSSRAKIGCLGG